MKPERWARVEHLCHSAMELDASEREHFLERECAGDPELLREVMSLVREIEADPEFLETPIGVRTEPPLDLAPGRESVGPYRLIRLLGRGGMGEVYLGTRRDGEVDQFVAVKVMRRGLDTADLIARFRTERRILATLNHPNVARLYDVGATDDGLPYLVMEYVEGQALLEYCDRLRLDVTQRLRLFLKVCDAVQHAHRSLVVHRDLKPGNILVNEAGEPKLLDFGIAKILDPDADDLESLTRTGARILTPEYASPEQLRGDPVTTVTDVHALGTMLFELLSGHHPFESARGSIRALEMAVLDQAPGKPSAAIDLTHTRDRSDGSTVTLTPETVSARRGVEPHRLRRRLAGDLDTIVLTAMRKEMDRRYASAASLAADVQRHLGGLPVVARPPTASYRLGKFVARNRAAVTGGVALASLLAVSSVVTLAQNRRIRQESELVVSERDKALEVKGFLLEMFGTTGPDRAAGDSVSIRQMLDLRAETLAEEYAADPMTLAEMQDVLAEGYEKLGLLSEAEALATIALAGRREMLSAVHPDVARSLNTLGWVLHRQDRYDEAAELLGEAVAIRRQLYPEGHAELARGLNDLALATEAGGDLEGATRLLQESLTMRRAVVGEEHRGVAVTLSNLAANHFRRGNSAEATRIGAEAVELFERLMGPDHARTLVARANLSVFRQVAGDLEGAGREQEVILRARERVLGKGHPDVGAAMTNLAVNWIAQGRLDEADSLLAEAERRRRQGGEGNGRALATVLSARAQVATARGNGAEAVTYRREALAVTLSAVGTGHINTALDRLRLAESLSGIAALGEAAEEYRLALPVVVEALGAGHPTTIGARTRFGTVLGNAGEPAAAYVQYAAALTEVVDRSGAGSNEAFRLRARMAVVALRAGDTLAADSMAAAGVDLASAEQLETPLGQRLLAIREEMDRR